MYPIGIPVLYAFILWKNRALLNPSIDTQSGGEGGDAKHKLSREELQELEEKVKARRNHPELVPSMFLWKDFGKALKGTQLLETFRFQMAHTCFVHSFLFFCPSVLRSLALYYMRHDAVR